MSNTLANDPRWMSQTGSSDPDNSENKRVNVSKESTYLGKNENHRITFNEDGAPEEKFWYLEIPEVVSSGFALAIPASLPNISSMYIGEVELSYNEKPTIEEFVYYTFETTWEDLPEYGLGSPNNAPVSGDIVIIFVTLPSLITSEDFDILINFDDSSSLEGVAPFKAVALNFLDIPQSEEIKFHYYFDGGELNFIGFGVGIVHQLKINGSVVDNFDSSYSAPSQYVLRTIVPSESIPSLETFTLEISYSSDKDDRVDSFEITNPVPS